MTARPRRLVAPAAAAMLPGCGTAPRPADPPPRRSQTANDAARHAAPSRRPRATAAVSGRIPRLLDRHDVYAAGRPGRLAPQVRRDPPRVYVPNSKSNTVDVIDQRAAKVVDHFAVGALPQHVTPSWDLRTLWVTNDVGNSLTPIDPRTGRHGMCVWPQPGRYSIGHTGILR
jgi:YVTN family beta-propeller protein